MKTLQAYILQRFSLKLWETSMMHQACLIKKLDAY
jgi:hypothetical protein